MSEHDPGHGAIFNWLVVVAWGSGLVALEEFVRGNWLNGLILTGVSLVAFRVIGGWTGSIQRLRRLKESSPMTGTIVAALCGAVIFGAVWWFWGTKWADATNSNSRPLPPKPAPFTVVGLAMEPYVVGQRLSANVFVEVIAPKISIVLTSYVLVLSEKTIFTMTGGADPGSPSSMRLRSGTSELDLMGDMMWKSFMANPQEYYPAREFYRGRVVWNVSSKEPLAQSNCDALRGGHGIVMVLGRAKYGNGDRDAVDYAMTYDSNGIVGMIQGHNGDENIVAVSPNPPGSR